MCETITEKHPTIDCTFSPKNDALHTGYTRLFLYYEQEKRKKNGSQVSYPLVVDNIEEKAP